jgi:LytS/YehU family sensor histidine kinase
MCIELAEFFRESVRAGAQHHIPLSTELDLMRRYFAIERLRFGDRLAVDFQIESSLEQTTVPALLLQPLAENAVRHGIATLVGGGTVTVKATPGRGHLLIQVENPYDPDEPHHGTGIGLKNVRARLETTYGTMSSLRVESGGGRFIVSLSLPGNAPA